MVAYSLRFFQESFPHETFLRDIPSSFHPSFELVLEKLKKWLKYFPDAIDNSVFNDLLLFYLIATKEYLDHRSTSHLFRLILSIHVMQKKLLHAEVFSPQQRDLKVRWIPTNLIFPFASKPVMGCLIGFNLMERYELFDEENVFLALQKYLPQLRVVSKSSYCHLSQHKTLKIFYFEIEKRKEGFFSLQEQNYFKSLLKEKIKNSIQTLSPSIFMGRNEEETYKNILVLSQEIQTIYDLPQAYITLDQQTVNEIVFRISLVYISPFHKFSWKERFFDCSFVSERIIPVRRLDNHPIEAHIFRLSLQRDISLLRSNGSLDFYSARQKVVSLMTCAIGEFRDYNGGILINQQELLQAFKSSFPEIVESDLELLESFFYGLTPLQKQAILRQDILQALFKHFLENKQIEFPKESNYFLKIYRDGQQIFFVARGESSSFTQPILETFREPSYQLQDKVYNIVTTSEGVFFNCALLPSHDVDTESFLESIQESLYQWEQKLKRRQILRIAVEYTTVSLDPRIGGDSISVDVLPLLFEGLTRFNQNGEIENAVAESIEVSSNLKQYIFKLRLSFWNDGSPVTAYDFEYAWKKILSPDFKTAFANRFYIIKNAKDAKEGKIPLEEVGVYSLNERTLKVELLHPTPYFLQLLAHPLFSPVHRFVDQKRPQWPYQSEKNYPCNGPFQLKMNQPTKGYQCIKNPLYWDINRVTLDQVILTLMNSPQAFQAFQRKEVDWIGNPFGGWHSFYVPTESDRVVSFPNSYIVWQIFNTTIFPFNNLKFRKAFAYALRREEIATSSFMPLSPAYSPLFLHTRSPKRTVFPQADINMARSLFHEALDEMGITLKDLPPLSLVFNRGGIREYIAISLKKQWKECFGIECELKPLSWDAFFDQSTKSDFQMSLIHWTSWIDDPIYTLSAFRSQENALNFTKWEHMGFKRLLDLSEQEVNLFQRSNYLLQAEELLCEEVPLIPIFYQPYQALINKDLHVIYRIPCGPFVVGQSFYNKKQGV